MQFGSGVYYAGSVNYALFGAMFSEFRKTWPHNPEYCEFAALEFVNHWKENPRYCSWALFEIDSPRALGFTRLGFEGKAYGGAPAAVLPLTPNPSNVGPDSPLKWKWIGFMTCFDNAKIFYHL